MKQEKKIKEKKNKNEFGCLWLLIGLDFIPFYFTFFHSFIKWLDNNKGITFTLFLFVTFLLSYQLYYQGKKKDNEEKILTNNVISEIEKLSKKCDEIIIKLNKDNENEREK